MQVEPQLLDPHDRKWSRFVTTNGLVTDAAAELEEEELVRPWSAEEKRIFMDKFLLFPKVGRMTALSLLARLLVFMVKVYEGVSSGVAMPCCGH